MFTPYDRDSELYHWGILGMHWGIRRFQPYPKGYKGNGKEVGQAARKEKPKKRKLSKEAQKRAKMRSEAADLKAQTQLDVARAEAAEAKQYAEMAERANNYRPRKSLFKTMSKDAKRALKKEKAIRSGDPKKVQRYRKLMTTEEYREAVARCNLTMDLELQSLQKVSKIGETIASGAASVARIGQSGISIQNTIADVRNGISKSEKKWKKWGEKDDSKEKAWQAKERAWREEEESRKKERYEREMKKADQDSYFAKLKIAVETGIDPDTGQSINSSSRYYNAWKAKTLKGKDLEEFMKKNFGVDYPLG